MLGARSFARRDLLLPLVSSRLVSSRYLHCQQAQGKPPNGKPSGNSGQVTFEVAMLVLRTLGGYPYWYVRVLVLDLGP